MAQARVLIVDDEPDLVELVALTLERIVANLIGNALEHGGRDVAVRVGRDGIGPFVEVADRGPGIAPEDMERVFEPFFTRATRGTGLGLFLARELAQSNGATLLHESPSGGGSLFRIVFADPGRWQ